MAALTAAEAAAVAAAGGAAAVTAVAAAAQKQQQYPQTLAHVYHLPSLYRLLRQARNLITLCEGASHFYRRRRPAARVNF